MLEDELLEDELLEDEEGLEEDELLEDELLEEELLDEDELEDELLDELLADSLTEPFDLLDPKKCNNRLFMIPPLGKRTVRTVRWIQTVRAYDLGTGRPRILGGSL
ncbi:MAG: hypothetical protein LW870_25505 [Pirellula sp.]|nr:hypothetical protein [Pirellula sp.]